MRDDPAIHPASAEKLIQLQSKINKLEIYLQRERELNHVCQKCGFMNKDYVVPELMNDTDLFYAENRRRLGLQK